jgi:hypothetical protein
VVEYDPARLTPDGNAPTSSTEILCHVRFQPVGQTHIHSASVHPALVMGAPVSPHTALLEVPVRWQTRGLTSTSSTWPAN